MIRIRTVEISIYQSIRLMDSRVQESDYWEADCSTSGPTQWGIVCVRPTVMIKSRQNEINEFHSTAKRWPMGISFELV